MKTPKYKFTDPFAGLEFDLRLPSWIVIIFFYLVGILLAMIPALDEQVYQNYQLALTILIFSILCTIVCYSSPKMCNLVILSGLLGLVVYVVWGLGKSEALPLILLPGVIAFFIAGFYPSLVLAIAQTILLYLAWQAGIAGITTGTMLAILACIWILEGGFFGLVYNLKSLDKWNLARYEEATLQLEEVRSSRSAMAQTTKDMLEVNRQLSLMNDKLDVARQVAEAAQKAKTAFVANVSHEFRTPLNVILGIIDILLENPQLKGEELPTSIKEDLETIQRNSEHLSALIGDVLDLSQVDSGRLTLHKERVDLADIVTKGLVVVRPLLTRKNLNLSIDIAKDLPDIYCDRKRIRQVIINLLSNAARFTNEGEIGIRILHDEKDVVVCVQDTGPGISKADIANLFQPFAQGEIQTPDGISSGLGLSISRQFVELHQGKMWVESEINQGSTFYFSLPILPISEKPTSPTRYIREDWIWRMRTSSANLPANVIKPMILLYDETAGISTFLERYFDEYEFIRAQNPDEARVMAEQNPIRSLVVNTGSIQTLLPVIEDFVQISNDVPVIGYCFPARGERVKEAGVQDFLVKPITRAKLAESLAKLDQDVTRILVVDDNQDQLNLLKQMLSGILPQAEVDILADPSRMISLMHQKVYDLLLVDIMMPGIDGWELIGLKNADLELQRIPVFIISGHDPDDQPRLTRYLIASMGDGISVEQSMRNFQALTYILNNIDSDVV